MTEVLGKRALITGAASGIGRMLAEHLADLGANIVIWDIDAAGMSAAKQSLESRGTQVHCYQCDLTDRHSVAETAQHMRDADLHIDILINNAGIVSGGYLLDISDEQIERTFAVNTLALFWVTRQFLPDMIHNGAGHIVTIASAAGLTGTARQADYSASKFAAVGFDESLRVELKNLGTPVMTTVVCPYYIDTGMFHGVKTRFSWALPILKPEYVVKKTIQAIQKNKRRLIMPRTVYSVYMMRLLPVACKDALMRMFGVNVSMDDFVGRDRH